MQLYEKNILYKFTRYTLIMIKRDFEETIVDESESVKMFKRRGSRKHGKIFIYRGLHRK